MESVKPGGAAQIAGLVAGDMILKVSSVIEYIFYNGIDDVFLMILCPSFVNRSMATKFVPRNIPRWLA